MICDDILLAGDGTGYYFCHLSVCGARTGAGDAQPGSQEDEAAILLGASGWQMFRRVTLPNIRWALLYGVVLTNARAIGEFGAVSVVSGSIRGETLSLPLQIELLEQDYNTVGSFTAAALLTLMAIITLFLKSMLQWRLENQEKRAQQEENHEH